MDETEQEVYIKKNNIYSIGFGISVALIIIGALFKIQHWPYGLLISIIGFCLLGLIGILRFIFTTQKDAILTVTTIFIVAFSVRGIMKLMKHPWYSQMTIILFAIAVIWLLLNAVKMIRSDKLPIINAKNILFALGALLIVTGVVFKFQHLPFASPLTMLGLSFSLISFFIPSK